MGLDIWFKDDIAQVVTGVVRAKLEMPNVPVAYERGVLDTAAAIATALGLQLDTRAADANARDRQRLDRAIAVARASDWTQKQIDDACGVGYRDTPDIAQQASRLEMELYDADAWQGGRHVQ